MATPQQINAITALYVGYFDRAPDPAGLQFWIDQLSAGREFNTIAADFAASPEAQALYPYLVTPGVSTPSAFITSIYLNLFNRAPDAAGLAFWTGVLNDGSVSVADMIEDIMNGAQDGSVDKATLDNKVAVGFDFATETSNVPGFTFDAAAKAAAVAALDGVTDDAATVDAAKAATDTYVAGAANPGDTFTLTTGPDALVGTAANDTFNALTVNATGTNATTLSAFDSIDGGAGTDTLNIFATAGLNAQFPANTSVKGVEVVNVNWLNNNSVAGSSLANVANYTGVKQLWQVGAATNVTNATGDMTVGFRNVDNTRLNDAITMATGQTTANIALDNSYGFVNTNAATTVNVTGKKADAGTFTLNVNNTAAATSVAVNTGVATILTTGAAAVTTVDASGSTGDITYTTSADVSVSTGSGNDTVTLNTLAANAVVNLGAGDDKLLGAAGSAVASGSYDGGAGTDTVSSAMINAANGSKFLNFENIDVSGATGAALDVELMTGSTITGLTLNGGAGGSTLNNVAAGVGLTVAGNNTGTTVIGVKGAAAGTADSFTTTFAGMAAVGATVLAPTTVAAGTVVTNGVEALNVVSGGTGFVTNTLEVSDDKLQTLNITGDKALALTFDVAGSGTLPMIGDAVNGVKMIDGSAATGALNINTANLNVANAGLTVNTGAGKDMIMLAQKATVDAGAGDDVITTAAAGGTLTGGAGVDTFDVSAATATGTTEATSVLTTINDFMTGDKIDFSAFASGAFNTTKVALGAGVTNLDLALAAAGNQGANETSWFQYAGNTYIVSDTGALAGDGAFGAGDTVVKLAGLVDLSNDTFAGTVLTGV